jgi:hypothetical protein
MQSSIEVGQMTREMGIVPAKQDHSSRQVGGGVSQDAKLKEAQFERRSRIICHFR